MKTLKVTDHGQVRYVQDYDDDTQTTALAPIDTQKIAREWGDEYVSTMNGMLRQYATPTAPAGNRHPQVTGISSPDELSARNERFRWTTVEVVILVAITAAGIVLIVQRAMELDTVATIAGWLVLSGFGGVASATWVSHQESQLTPEAIEMERVRGDYDIATLYAESNGKVVGAIAESIILDAQTKHLNAEAQRAANMAYLESSKPVQRPQRAPVQAYDDSYQDYDEQPVCAPESPSLATWNDGESEELIVAPTIAPDRDLIAMLAEIDRVYAHCEEHNSDIITLKLQWGDRGDWDADVKEKAKRVLAYFADNYDAPLIYRGNENGGRYRLNRQAWKRQVARLIIAREWGN